MNLWIHTITLILFLYVTYQVQSFLQNFMTIEYFERKTIYYLSRCICMHKLCKIIPDRDTISFSSMPILGAVKFHLKEVSTCWWKMKNAVCNERRDSGTKALSSSGIFGFSILTCWHHCVSFMSLNRLSLFSSDNEWGSDMPEPEPVPNVSNIEVFFWW